MLSSFSVACAYMFLELTTCKCITTYEACLWGRLTPSLSNCKIRVVLHTGLRPCGVFPIHSRMLTGVVIILILFRQHYHCCSFPVIDRGQSCSRLSDLLALSIFLLSEFSWFYFSLRRMSQRSMRLISSLLTRQ